MNNLHKHKLKVELKNALTEYSNQFYKFTKSYPDIKTLECLLETSFNFADSMTEVNDGILHKVADILLEQRAPKGKEKPGKDPFKSREEAAREQAAADTAARLERAAVQARERELGNAPELLKPEITRNLTPEKIKRLAQDPREISQLAKEGHIEAVREILGLKAEQGINLNPIEFNLLTPAQKVIYVKARNERISRGEVPEGQMSFSDHGLVLLNKVRNAVNKNREGADTSLEANPPSEIGVPNQPEVTPSPGSGSLAQEPVTKPDQVNIPKPETPAANLGPIDIDIPISRERQAESDKYKKEAEETEIPTEREKTPLPPVSEKPKEKPESLKPERQEKDDTVDVGEPVDIEGGRREEKGRRKEEKKEEDKLKRGEREERGSMRPAGGIGWSSLLPMLFGLGGGKGQPSVIPGEADEGTKTVPYETYSARAKRSFLDPNTMRFYSQEVPVAESKLFEGKLSPKESLQRRLKKQKYKIVYIQDGKKVEVFAGSIRGVRRVIYGKKQFRIYNTSGSDLTGYFKKLINNKNN